MIRREEGLSGDEDRLSDIGDIMEVGDSFKQVWGRYGKKLRSWDRLPEDLASFIEEGIRRRKE